jgi:hypothetical protein
MLATVNLFREAKMTTLDNAFQATGSGNTYSDFTAVPRAKTIWGFLTSASQARFSVGGLFSGWYWGVQGLGGAPDDSGKVGPAPNDYCSYAGVFGTGVYVTGVAGTSINNVGVYGQAGEDPDFSIPTTFSAGVVGAGNISSGVVGWSTNKHGVVGWGYQGNGVLGRSSQFHGVSGFSFNNTAIKGVSGVGEQEEGPTIPDGVTIGGVVGTSDQRHGVIGTSRARVGIYGYSINSVGVFGRTDNAASWAGLFVGNVRVLGTIYANNLPSPLVPFPDGSRRALYCMASPEHWFEDFGSAKLARGRALVKLDANFAKVIKRGDYRVFVTPEGDCRGLYVRRKSGNSFEVRELTGGKSSIAFSYRIVGRRKDIKQPRRFAKVDMPLPAPTKPPRPPRKSVPTAADLRAFVARVEKEGRERLPKGAEKVRARMRSNNGSSSGRGSASSPTSSV